MTDPLIGSIHNATGTLKVLDAPSSSADDPRVQLSLANSSMQLSAADIQKAMFILKQAHDLLTERKGNAFLEKNFNLPF